MEHLASLRFPKDITCPECGRATQHYLIENQMAQTQCGVSAEIEREAGVTYKAAWKLCQLVRTALAERFSNDDEPTLSGLGPRG